MSSAMSSTSPKMVGNFALHRKLGSGSFASVYLGVSTVDGSTTGIGTWAFSEAMRKTNYAGNLPTLRATMKALVDEGGYPQDFHIAASRMIREDPEAVSLFSSRG